MRLVWFLREPTITTPAGVRRPDLIIRYTVYVVDVQIIADSHATSLAAAHMMKARYYTYEPILEFARRWGESGPGAFLSPPVQEVPVTSVTILAQPSVPGMGPGPSGIRSRSLKWSRSLALKRSVYMWTFWRRQGARGQWRVRTLRTLRPHPSVPLSEGSRHDAFHSSLNFFRNLFLFACNF